MSPLNSANIFQPSIDLERSEIRYIFYAHDQDDLLADFEKLGFLPHVYEQTPVTKTLYFGSKRGIRPGLSIKARIYSSTRYNNVYHFKPSDRFSLLEIKSTIDLEDSYLFGFHPTIDSQILPYDKGLLEKEESDVIYRIQKATEDGLLRDSTLKTKNRLKNVAAEPSGDSQLGLKLEEIITVLTEASDYDIHFSKSFLNILNTKIRPIYHHSLIPYVLTQYNRIHLLPENLKWKEIIRVTIDPGVEYYDTLYNGDDFIKEPNFTAEFIMREQFSRLEFKLDPRELQKDEELKKDIAKIIKKYKCIAYLSKKWSGVTKVSERHIERQAFWRESLWKDISGFFPVDNTWFSFGSVTLGLLNLIKKSSSFRTYESDPRVLVKNENYVLGYLGLPSPSLVITVEGPYITYHLPTTSYPVKLLKNLPPFYISEEFIFPVRALVVSSKEQLDEVLHQSIDIEGYSFFRSYGFLVVNEHSNRAYKLTIERKTAIGEQKEKTNIYCKMRYIGTIGRLNKINEQKIYDELEDFYEQFAPIMMKPLSLGESNLEQFL
jgi:hypothetical protein